MAKKKKLIKLDVACGQNKQEGYIGIDIANIPGVDIVHDLEIYPWPIESESCEEVNVSHYIEHTKDIIKFMEEIYRILKPSKVNLSTKEWTPGGKCMINAPYYTSMRCWQDPTHVRAISEATFLYFNKEWRTVNKLEHYPITCDFDYQYGYQMTQDWASRNEEARNFAVRHYWNVVQDIQISLTKK